MKLRVRNLGRIEDAALDIRPLTVFVGKNNTNKTWVAYALYGLLRHLTWRSPAVVGLRSMGATLIKIQTEAVRKQVFANIERAIDGLPKEGDVGTVELEVSRRALLEGVDEPTEFTLVSEHLRKLLHLEGELSREASATLEVSAAEFRERDATVAMLLGYVQRNLRMQWRAEKDEIATISVQLGGDGEELRKRAKVFLRALAQRFSSMGSLLLLPAERKALASTYREMEALGQTSDSLSTPVSSYVTFLRSAEGQWRKGVAPAMPSAIGYLDDRILGGSTDFLSSGAGERLMFSPRSGPSLPMHAASSMVRSLVGLEVYLRYAARSGDTLIIDEPEMNAHPEGQVALVELIAHLVNQGIRVVMTTHSPYVVDHLNNLIGARRLSEADQDEAAKKFRLGTRTCFLRAEDVAAYDFVAEDDASPVRVKSIFPAEDPSASIDWDTFGRTSDYLSSLYTSEILPRSPWRESP
ncbi:AAA family ATPase [Polyangium sp. 6x1]|uniref:AAA family ATPase n=1 Tax=Polyangium sp. 6x1 TaxID=3042689 RepID=UPI00248305C2|nr:AAA family ATPase [Polyangium sp. 6x1]MDI1443607.1 AAA family ATPase [Polyangium sp. 6x1]